MQETKILSYMGLATRAGRTVSGEFSVEKSVRQGRARLVLVSDEASENAKKKFRNLCSHYKVPMYCFGSSAELGAACGKEFRMSAAVEDEGLAAAMVRILEQEAGTGGVGQNVK
ncbi:MAG: ribosomal L7Ae/L30e/S12e/Gadd45 family protein [Eubacteriales bacterium]|nr:ribosomal L7Ae/L30e/S12e/Gadd45 family protein [Eubacteriales bacterium]